MPLVTATVTNEAGLSTSETVQIIVSGQPGTGNPMNKVVVTNRSGVAVTNHPLQFGRPFLLGEIAHFPMVVADGVPLSTQADVRNRHPDGSVKYAVMSVVFPTLFDSKSVVLNFVDQPSGNNLALTKEQMLDPAFNFEAIMKLEFTSDRVEIISARNILSDGNYKIWASGSIAQTIELADDTTARKYDVGNGDGFRPFRPRFYATFWPQLNWVQIRFVGENGLSTELEDLLYKLTLSTGLNNPQVRYSLDLTNGANKKWHWYATSWTKQFWLGGAPEQRVNIDHNVAYISSTKYIQNYDSSIVIPEASLASWWRTFTAKANDLYDGPWNGQGIVQAAMATSGGRPDLGPMPTWTSLWLFSGDWRARDSSLVLADLGPCWPYHLRETDPARRLSRLDPVGSGTGLGHTVSSADRPSLMTTDQLPYTQYSNTKPPDRLGFVGPFSQGPWSFDGAHQPAMYYVPYLLTGDPFYLNEMYLWSGFSALRYTYTRRGTVAPLAAGYGTGGGIDDQLRGAGWVVRNRAEAAVAAPDGTPEKAFFTLLVRDAIARWEGEFGILGTSLDGDPTKVLAAKLGNFYSGGGEYNTGPLAGKVPLNHNWESNGAKASIALDENGGIFQKGQVSAFTSPWMQLYTLGMLAHVRELGFPVEALELWSAKWLTDIIIHSGEPRLVGMYHLPTESTNGTYLTWNDLLTKALTPFFLTNTGPLVYDGNPLATYWHNNLRADDRQAMAGASLASLVDLGAPDAQAAWAWFKVNVYDKVVWNTGNLGPKWAIVPRS